MKWQADKERKKTKVWKIEDRIMLSTKNLVFKESSGSICRFILSEFKMVDSNYFIFSFFIFIYFIFIFGNLGLELT